MKPAQVRIHKSLLRKQLRSELKKLSSSGRKVRSRRIIEKFLRTRSFKRAQKIALYASMTEEVQTQELIRSCLKQEKEVYLPVMTTKSTLQLYRIERMKDLVVGPFGIKQPKKVKANLGSPGRMDVVVVPGLAFDRRGGRLGRGKGYYDRFLSKAKRAEKVGLCFKKQLVRTVPREKHDVLLDRVISEK